MNYSTEQLIFYLAKGQLKMCLSDIFSHEFLLQEVLILKFLAYLLNKKNNKRLQN